MKGGVRNEGGGGGYTCKQAVISKNESENESENEKESKNEF